MHVRRLSPLALLGFAAATSIGLVACSGAADDPDSLAFAERPTVAEAVVTIWDQASLPEASTELLGGLSDEDARYALVDANLACVRQANAFQELSDIDDLRAEVAEGHDGDVAGLDAFIERQDSDAALRGVVTNLFLDNCPPG